MYNYLCNNFISHITQSNRSKLTHSLWSFDFWDQTYQCFVNLLNKPLPIQNITNLIIDRTTYLLPLGLVEYGLKSVDPRCFIGTYSTDYLSDFLCCCSFPISQIMVINPARKKSRKESTCIIHTWFGLVQFLEETLGQVC